MVRKVVGFIFIFLVASGLILIVDSLKFPFYRAVQSVQEKGEYIPTDDIRIGQVFSQSPAEAAGIKEGDIIYSVGVTRVKDIDTFVELVNENEGQRKTIKVLRGKELFTFEITPVYDPSYKRYTIGVELVNYIVERAPLYILVPKTIVNTFQGKYDPIPGIKTGQQSLLGVVYGLFLMAVGIGIGRLKKWALVLYTLLGLSYVVTFFGMPVLLFQSRLSIINDPINLIPYVFAAIIVPSLVYFLYNWKLFR